MMFRYTYPHVILLFFIGAFALLPWSAQGDVLKNRPRDLQYYATALAQEVKQGVIKTHYAQVLGALQKLDDAAVLPTDQLVDPLTPLYELLKSLNVEGREYFLVPELKLYIAQVARRFAQRIYVSVHKKKQPVAKATKANMLKRLKTTLSLLNPKQMPVAPVISHIRYVQAVVENLPDNTNQLKEDAQLLFSLVQLAIEPDIAAGGAILQTIVEKGKQIYRGKMVAEVTAAEVLGKQVIAQAAPQTLAALDELYETSKFQETKYAVIRVWGQITRTYYGSPATQPVDPQASKQAYTAYNRLIKIAKSKDIVSSPWYIQCAAITELMLLQHLLGPPFDKIVGQYLEEITVLTPKQSSAGRFLRLWNRGKGQLSTQVQCLLEHRDIVFRMGNLEYYEVVMPQDDTSAALERIEQQQKRIMKHLGVSIPAP